MLPPPRRGGGLWRGELRRGPSISYMPNVASFCSSSRTSTKLGELCSDPESRQTQKKKLSDSQPARVQFSRAIAYTFESESCKNIRLDTYIHYVCMYK